MWNRTRCLSIVLAVSLALPAFAATTGTGSVQTGSGATSSSDPNVALRAARMKDFWAQVLKTKAAEAAYRILVKDYVVTITDFRRQCRLDIRKANRDTQMTVTLRCFRGEMTQLRELLTHQTEYLKVTAGLSKSIRDDALARVDLFTDAVNTIINAIDAGVYVKPEDLMESKKKLRELYQSKAWNVWTAVRADRAISWVDFLLQDIDGLTTPDTAATWTDARACLLVAETQLQTFMDNRDTGTGSIAPVLTAVKPCLDTVQKALTDAKTMAGSGSTMSGSSSSK